MFSLSKIIWFFLSSLNLFIIFLLLCFVFKKLRYKLIYKSFFTFTLFFFIIVGFFPTGDLILNKLEKNYPAQNSLPNKIDGLIILGGPGNPNLTKEHDQVSFNEAGERLTETIKLIKIYNPSKIIFSGGSGSLNPDALPHTFVAKKFFSEMGIDIQRIIFESESRNTYENILFSKNLINPLLNEKWVLITSSFHMTRAMNIAEKLQWEIIPYPVDFRTGKNKIQYKPSLINLLNNFNKFDLASHEIIGLISYYYLDRTNKIF